MYIKKWLTVLATILAFATNTIDCLSQVRSDAISAAEQWCAPILQGCPCHLESCNDPSNWHWPYNCPQHNWRDGDAVNWLLHILAAGCLVVCVPEGETEVCAVNNGHGAGVGPDLPCRDDRENLLGWVTMYNYNDFGRMLSGCNPDWPITNGTFTNILCARDNEVSPIGTYMDRVDLDYYLNDPILPGMIIGFYRQGDDDCDDEIPVSFGFLGNWIQGQQQTPTNLTLYMHDSQDVTAANPNCFVYTESVCGMALGEYVSQTAYAEIEGGSAPCGGQSFFYYMRIFDVEYSSVSSVFTKSEPNKGN